MMSLTTAFCCGAFRPGPAIPIVMVLMIAEMSEAYRLNRGRDWRVKAVPQFEIGAGPGQYETMIGPPDGAWRPLHRGGFALTVVETAPRQ
jgi:hypothetical protein